MRRAHLACALLSTVMRGVMALRVVAAVVVVAVGVGVADAGPVARASSGLERRVADLERENAELKRRLEKIERAQNAAPPPAPAVVAAEPPASEAAPVEVSDASEAEQTEGIGLGLTAHYPNVRASFQLFGDAGFIYADPPEADVDKATFVLGSLDLFTTAQLGDHFQVLSEIVTEGGTDSNEISFEQERLWGSWTLSDALYVKLGREHSPVSYWDRRYHHGRWLWTSATQPFLARFEDDGGPLPIHQVGVEAGGKVDVGIGTLQYVGVISNGRGREPDEVTNVADRNSAKAFDFGLGFAPHALPGLVFGGDFHGDEIPSDHDDPARDHAIRELIGTGYLAYSMGNLETLGELGYLQHDDRNSDRTFRHRTGYFQAGYHLGDWTPYGRIDARSMHRGDPFFAPEDVDLDGWEQILGLRYELAANVALKVEGGFGRTEQRRNDGNTTRRGLKTIGLQLSWGF